MCRAQGRDRYFENRTCLQGKEYIIKLFSSDSSNLEVNLLYSESLNLNGKKLLRYIFSYTGEFDGCL